MELFKKSLVIIAGVTFTFAGLFAMNGGSSAQNGVGTRALRTQFVEENLQVGQHFEWNGVRYQVVDGNRAVVCPRVVEAAVQEIDNNANGIQRATIDVTLQATGATLSGLMSAYLACLAVPSASALTLGVATPVAVVAGGGAVLAGSLCAWLATGAYRNYFQAPVTTVTQAPVTTVVAAVAGKNDADEKPVRSSKKAKKASR